MRLLYFGIWCFALALGCVTARNEPTLYPPTSAPDGTRVPGPLKAHLHSGNLAVFDEWRETDSALVGLGRRYGLDRESLGPRGNISLPFTEIALLEMDVRSGSRPTGVAGMVVWSVLWGVTTISCVADPKSCFGSCPTFYVDTEAGETLVAEGFSGSIARALEARDLDAIGPVQMTGNRFIVTMRNEALETHAVRRLQLVAAKRPATGRVLAGPNDLLYPATMFAEPSSCLASEGDCLAALRTNDGVERTSPADSTDLAEREIIELSFPPARGKLGLALATRQSLMTTFLFYETMEFIGHGAGETLAALERAGPETAGDMMGMARLVGGIDLEVWDGAAWQPIGTHEEAGPLATEVRVFPFEHSVEGPIHVRMVAPKGAWRFDWAALAELGEPVEPVVADPVSISGDGPSDSRALSLLLDPDRHLVTYPTESYDIAFELPSSDGAWELFIETEGYYYEWMRSEWLGKENPALAALALTDPRQALRVLAPAFKRAEPQMERRFWSSRFGRQ